MISEERGAMLLSIVMVSALVITVLAFLGWTIASDVPSLVSIYRGLAPAQQVEINRFFHDVGFLASNLALAVAWFFGWRRRPTGPRPLPRRGLTPS